MTIAAVTAKKTSPRNHANARPRRSVQRHERTSRGPICAPARAPAGRGRRGGATATHPVSLHRLLRRPADERQHRGAEQQHRRHREERVPHRRRRQLLRRCRIVAASGRDGSKKKISPSAGFGANATPPVTMRASPSRRARAPSRAPCRRRGRGARCARRSSRTCATVDAERERALQPAARHRAQPVGEDRDHQRRDHQAEDQDPREQAVAAQRDVGVTDGFPSVIR